MHTARIMLPDSYVTKRSGFQRLQGNHADLLWAGQLADSGAAEVTCRWHRGIAAFSGVAIGFGGSDDDYDDATTVLFFILCCQRTSTSMQ